MILYGASGHGKVIIDILEAKGIKIDYIVDDNPNLQDLLGYEVRPNTGHYPEAIISVGAPEVRKKIAEEIKVENYVTAIHPTATVSPRAVIGSGTVVMQGAIIQTCSKIGEHCIVNTGASVDHDCILDDYVHVAPHATLAGGVKVGEGSWIGAGAVVKQGVNIGAWCMIGAGAVVVKDVPDGLTVVGVPAQEMKR